MPSRQNGHVIYTLHVYVNYLYTANRNAIKYVLFIYIQSVRHWSILCFRQRLESWKCKNKFSLLIQQRKRWLTSILCNYWTCYNRGCSRSVSDFIKNCWQWFFLGKTKKFNASSLICLSVAMATVSKYFGQKSAKITLKFNNFTAKLPLTLPFFHNTFHFVW